MKKLFTLLLTCLATAAIAAPLKLKIITGFPAGGPDDTIARLLQTEIQKKYPDSVVVVEPTLGAGGLIALNKLVQYEKGEYIEVLFSGSNLVGATYITKTNTAVDLDKDVKIVAPIGYSKMVLLASKQSGVSDISGLTSLASLTSPRVGTAGNGSLSHLTAEHFFSQIKGASMLAVPYKGTSAVYPDLISGRVDYLFDFPMGAAPKIDGNLVVPVAITGNSRAKTLPNVPSLAELGIKNPPFSPWWAIYANKNISDSDYKMLNTIFVEIVTSKEVVTQMTEFGAVIWSREDLNNPNKWFAKQKEIFKKEASKFNSNSSLK